jgi:hypothetical protein
LIPSVGRSHLDLGQPAEERVIAGVGEQEADVAGVNRPPRSPFPPHSIAAGARLAKRSPALAVLGDLDLHRPGQTSLAGDPPDAPDRSHLAQIEDDPGLAG